MKISFIMPSLFPNLAEPAIDRISQIMAGADFEIVLAGPTDPGHPQVLWVPDLELRGNCPANAMAFKASSGEVIVYLSDDVLLTQEWRDITLPSFIAKSRDNPLLLGGFYAHPMRVGTVFGRYYPWFGIGLRTSIIQLGGFFDEGYGAHFGDSDLALRFWSAGGRCEIMPGNALEILSRERPKRNESGAFIQETEAITKETKKAHDLALLRSRWRDSVGRGWRMDVLRDFNHDIEPELLAVFCADQTVFWPDPMFGEIVKTYYRNIGYDFYFTYWDGGIPEV